MSHAEHPTRVTGDAENGVTVVQVAGELEMINGQALQVRVDSVLRTGVRRLVLDLSEVPFCDSAGVAALVLALRRAREAGATLYLDQPCENVRRVLRITGVIDLFPIWSDVRRGPFSE